MTAVRRLPPRHGPVPVAGTVVFMRIRTLFEPESVIARSGRPSPSRSSIATCPGDHVAVRVSEGERAEIKRRLDEAGIENEERDHEIAVGLFFEDPDGRLLEAITYR